MAEPIRVLHFADTHIGVELYGKSHPQSGMSTRVHDFLERMDTMIADARTRGVDLVIFAGDAFKTRTPNPTYQSAFARRMRDLIDLAPVVMLVGNHDVPPSAYKSSSIDIYARLRVPNVVVADAYDLHVVETARGTVAVGAAPYPIRQRLLEGVDTSGRALDDLDREVEAALTQTLDELAERADALGDVPRLLTGHFTVQGATLGSERTIMLGRDVQVPLSAVADPRWDYVALGHIHKQQNLTHNRIGMPPVVYSGSMERIDFGEEGDVKGYCWVNLERGATTWEFVPLETRRFITLRLDLRDSQDPTRDVLAQVLARDLTDAVVRLELLQTRETEARFNQDEVRQVLHRRGVHVIAGVKSQIEEKQQTSLGGKIEGLTDMGLLEHYLISRGDIDEGRRERLLALAKSILAPEDHYDEEE